MYDISWENYLSVLGSDRDNSNSRYMYMVSVLSIKRGSILNSSTNDSNHSPGELVLMLT